MRARRWARTAGPLVAVIVSLSLAEDDGTPPPTDRCQVVHTFDVTERKTIQRRWGVRYWDRATTIQVHRCGSRYVETIAAQGDWVGPSTYRR